MSIVRNVVGGVDTHADTHVAAAIDSNGGLLGVEAFPADAAGYEGLLGWLAGFGPIDKIGVEGTGSWGVGLARFLTEADIEVVEVDRPNRQTRRRVGKSDPTDAVAAARAALSGTASVTPKSRNGPVEQMRVLLVARRSARAQRIQSLNQLRHSGVHSSGADPCPGSRTVTRPDSSPRPQRCGPARAPTRSLFTTNIGDPGPRSTYPTASTLEMKQHRPDPGWAPR